jgi:hypothetical protein
MLFPFAASAAPIAGSRFFGGLYCIDGSLRCARTAAKTARNISGVNLPVFVL